MTDRHLATTKMATAPVRYTLTADHTPQPPTRRKPTAAITLLVLAVAISVVGNGVAPKSTTAIVCTLAGIAVLAVAGLVYALSQRTAVRNTTVTKPANPHRFAAELQALIDQYGQTDPGLRTEAQAMLAGLHVAPGDPMALGQAGRRLPVLRRRHQLPAPTVQQD